MDYSLDYTNNLDYKQSGLHNLCYRQSGLNKCSGLHKSGLHKVWTTHSLDYTQYGLHKQSGLYKQSWWHKLSRLHKQSGQSWTLLQDSLSWHPTTTTQHLSWKNCTGFPFQNVFNIKSLVCVSVLWMVLVLLTFLNHCMSTLRLVHYALLLTPTCWKSSNTNVRVMAFMLSLALDPTLGVHAHKTSLDTAQPCHFLKPNWKPSSSHSTSTPTYISTQFLLQSLCACARVHACMPVCMHAFPYNM